MGFLANLLFGEPARDESGATLPEKVRQWNAEGHQPSDSVGWGHEHVDEHGDAAHVRDHGQEAGATGLPRKIIPELEVLRVEPHLSSDSKHLELWVTFLNRSEAEIELRNVAVLKQRADVGRFLKPGESHELKVYSGETPTNDAEHRAIVQLKVVENGDYFEADFLIKYHYEQEEHGAVYVPEALELIRPVRDV